MPATLSRLATRCHATWNLSSVPSDSTPACATAEASSCQRIDTSRMPTCGMSGFPPAPARDSGYLPCTSADGDMSSCAREMHASPMSPICSSVLPDEGADSSKTRRCRPPPLSSQVQNAASARTATRCVSSNLQLGPRMVLVECSCCPGNWYVTYGSIDSAGTPGRKGAKPSTPRIWINSGFTAFSRPGNALAAASVAPARVAGTLGGNAPFLAV
mmetsp:Transcript_21011/g.53638  ORF Transcript_21011/g.53638 Transcript_21011/m.53638 type:complete len:215 (-) Transcript_21011:1026-1670(-)